MNNLIRIVSILILTAGCNPVDVYDPPAKSIRKLALVSIATNIGIAGAGAYSTFYASGRGLLEKNDPNSYDQQFMQASVVRITEAFNPTGWTILPPEDFVDSRAFAQFKQGVKIRIGSNALDKLTVHYNDMPPLMTLTKIPEVRAEMQKLAKELGVDAVGFVFLRKSYGTYLGISGTGLADMYVTVNMELLTAQEGQDVVIVKKLHCDAGGLKFSFLGNILLDTDAENLLLDAVTDAANYIVGEVQNEIQ